MKEKLLLRWNTSKIIRTEKSEQAIIDFFSNWFEKVVIYEGAKVDKLNALAEYYNTKLILNLDKNINTEGSHPAVMNVNVSRVYHLYPLKYCKHHIDVPLEVLKRSYKDIIIFDNDIVVGYGVKLLAEALGKNTKEVHFETHLKSIDQNYAKSETEILDLNDFLDSGLCVTTDEGKTHVRVPYHYNEQILSKFASIPEEDYLTFKKGLSQILEMYHEDNLDLKAELFIDARVKAMHLWAQENGRKDFVLGLSGGIDSTLCALLFEQLLSRYPKEGYSLQLLSLPISNSTGTTGQEKGITLVSELVETIINRSPLLRINFKTVELGSLSQAITDLKATKIEGNYLKQQSDYWLRPIIMHRYASLGLYSCMVSTTNYAEWKLGWMSQYLDIFNIMPIIDLMKSDIYRLAAYLKAPQNLLNVEPVGGLANGKTDEQCFGFKYEDFENFILNGRSNNYLAIQQMIAKSKFKRDRFHKDYVFALNEKRTYTKL